MRTWVNGRARAVPPVVGVRTREAACPAPRTGRSDPNWSSCSPSPCARTPSTPRPNGGRWPRSGAPGLQATAWQRLVAAAGGEANVKAYCAEQLGQRTAAPSASVPGSGGQRNGAGASGKSDNGKSAGRGNGKNG